MIELKIIVNEPENGDVNIPTVNEQQKHVSKLPIPNFGVPKNGQARLAMPRRTESDFEVKRRPKGWRCGSKFCRHMAEGATVPGATFTTWNFSRSITSMAMHNTDKTLRSGRVVTSTSRSKEQATQQSFRPYVGPATSPKVTGRLARWPDRSTDDG